MSIRKILIPVAAGLLISPALMAADLDGNSTETTFSTEYLGTAGATDIVTGAGLAVDLQAEYAIGDIITLSFSGAALDGTTMPTSVVVVPAGTPTINGITLGLLSADSSEAVYRVTDVVAGANNTTVGVIVPFAATPNFLDFDAQAVASAGGVTVSYSAATSTGLALDTGGGDLRSHDHILSANEYSVAALATVFDDVIDVDTDRLALVTGPDDDAEVTLVNAAITAGETTFVSQDITWTGDFSWIVDDDTATAGIQPAAGVVAATGCVVSSAGVTVTATTISYNCAAGASTLTLDPVDNFTGTDTANTTALSDGSFSVSITVNFTGFSTTAGTVAFNSLTAGSWTLNGYQSEIPYMPFGSSITQIIYLANRGSQSGEVTVDWIDKDGTSGSLGVIATLGAGTTLAIGPLIKDALPAAQQAGGRLALTVIANVPAADVQMNSQYNVSGNRAFTLHSDNR